jgi:phenylacetate-CoA ligase
MPWYDDIYSGLPTWCQHFAVSLGGLKWRHERLSGGFARYSEEFRSRDRWEPSQFKAYIEGELRKVLAHAFLSVPYYRDQWRKEGIVLEDLRRFDAKDLQRLPATPKQPLRDDPTRFLDASVVGSRGLRKYYSSGSTGSPVTVICSVDGHRRFLAAREARSFGWAGVSLRMPRSTMGGRSIIPPGDQSGPYYRYNWSEKQIYFSAYHLNEETVEQYVSALNRWRPEVFTGYAYSHFVLSQLMERRGLSLNYKPRALIMSSEKLTGDMKDSISRSFKAHAYEEYGSIENCVLGTECEAGRLHMNLDFGIVEIVDDECRPVPPGTAGRILGTSLLNDIQPLIRYEVGDLASWDDSPCPCGRNHLPTVKEIIGRLEDAVITRDGRKIVRLDKIFNGLDNIVEGQIVQEEIDKFTVNVVTRADLAELDKHTLSARLRGRLGDVQVEFLRMPMIPRTERGKFRAIISKVKAIGNKVVS